MNTDKIAMESPLEEGDQILHNGVMIGHETKLDDGEPVETIYYIYNNFGELLCVGDHERATEFLKRGE